MNQNISILAESITTRLSLAVDITDDYQESRVISELKIFLKDQDIQPVKNLSGYYLFLDLKGSNDTVLVQGGDYYFDNESENIELGELDTLCPVVNITLKPNPSYLFPSSATLIRGCVRDSQNDGISGATIRMKKTDFETQTTTLGEFVIYFRGLNYYEVETEDGKKMVKIDGKNPELNIEHPDYRNKKGKIRKKNVTVEVEEGKTTLLSITYP
ncbi:MAG: carboxypeptidase regulatory-like domain-containing protein [Methanosarcinales archaeon]|nr:carboxypeptidase regulatory-like domain-containing protein [Methanosarcinales archaeon]